MPVRHSAKGLFAALAGLSCLTAAGCAAGQAAVHDQTGSQGPSGTHGSSAAHGSAGTAGGTPATASTVIPAQLGDTWVYAFDSSVLGKGTETSRISAVSPAAGGQRATMASSLSLAGSKAPFKFSSVFTAGADGSVTFGSTSFMGSKLASANVNWPSPAALTPGRPHTSTVTGNFLGFRTTERVTITNLGPASVTVPAGTYQAVLLEQTVTEGAGNRDVIKSWVVNGIGQVKTDTTVIVKGQRSVSSAEVLTSFTKK
jgi:hypothetical protein